MVISSWLLCRSSTINLFVKIVHQGGYVELYDKPILVNEILIRNPKHCVAYPHVFKQPWAVVSPETMLMPGQKFYVVPKNTIRKLQRLSSRKSPSMSKEIEAIEAYDDQVGDVESFPCWLCTNDKKKGTRRDRKTTDNSCFGCLISATKIKGKNEKQNNGTKSSSSGELSESWTNLGNKRADSPIRRMSFDSWQPRLEIIAEE